MSAPATPPPGRKRKYRSTLVDLKACLHLLGIDPTLPWEMHHEPSLALRPFDPIADDYDPPENDYRHMRPIQKAEHAEETKRLRPAVDKTRRVAKKQAKHAAAMTRGDGALQEHLIRAGAHRTKWPKGRKLQSRGFPKR